MNHADDKIRGEEEEFLVKSFLRGNGKSSITELIDSIDWLIGMDFVDGMDGMKNER